MRYTVFADESGTSPDYKCFGIGCLILPSGRVQEFNSRFSTLSHQHGSQGELRWTKIKRNHGAMNLGLDMMQLLLTEEWRFSVIVVLKSAYRKWRAGNEEEAFYTIYTLLLKDRVKKVVGEYEVFFDDRSDAYEKQDEVVQIISNHMLRRVAAKGAITVMKKGDSKILPGIQVADLLTGAVTAAHNKFLDPRFMLAPAKKLMIERLASQIGWDDLVYDSYPEDAFNIWNFPEKEYRARPRSRRVMAGGKPDYIRLEDLSKG